MNKCCFSFLYFHTTLKMDSCMVLLSLKVVWSNCKPLCQGETLVLLVYIDELNCTVQCTNPYYPSFPMFILLLRCLDDPSLADHVHFSRGTPSSYSQKQCCGSVTFWYGSVSLSKGSGCGSGSPKNIRIPRIRIRKIGKKS